MDLQSWKDRVYDRLWGLRLRMETLGAKTATGALSALAFWPMIEAAQKGDFQALIAFGKLTADLGTDVLGQKLQEWQQRATGESETTALIETESAADPALTAAFASLLDKLDVLAVALERQNDDRAWLEETLRRENPTADGLRWVDTLIQQQVNRNTGLVIGKFEGNYYAGTPAIDSSNPETPDPCRAYLDGLHRGCLALPLATFGRTRSGQRVTLDRVYIDLNVDQWVKKDGSPYQHLEVFELNEARRLTLREAVETNKQLVIRGDPGSGKSTFLKHYLAEQAATYDAGAEAGGLLPVLITLRELVLRLRDRDLPTDWQLREEQLAETVRDYAVHAVRERYDAADFCDSFKTLMKSGRCLIAFDGIDEVAVEERAIVRDAIQAVISTFKPARVIVTCRTRSYYGDSILEGFVTQTIIPLEPEQIETFCRQWYQALGEIGQYPPSEARTRGDEMAEATQNPTVLEIASNPMLLTTLAVVHEQDNKLPQRRILLYDRAIDVLLTGWQGAKETLEATLKGSWPARMPAPSPEAVDRLAAFIEDKTRVRPLLEELAFYAHNSESDRSKKRTADIDSMAAANMVGKALGSVDLGLVFLRYVEDRAGLLVANGDASDRPASYSFAHRTFQEYLAGCHLLNRREDQIVNGLAVLATEGEYWSLAVRLAGEEIMYKRTDVHRLVDLAAALCPWEVKTATGNRLVLWSSQLAEIIPEERIREIPGNDLKESGTEFLDRLRGLMARHLGDFLPATERAEMGRVLARLGDPRTEITTVHAMPFCFVPKGPFMMGDKARQIDVPYNYWIAQYPVTQAQFAAFVQDRGYQREGFWTKEGWERRIAEDWKDPSDYGDSFMLPNHPVVGVSLYEASAFCAWMNDRLGSTLPNGWRFALPNDPEWEKAARGGLEIPSVALITAAQVVPHTIPGMRLTPNPAPARPYAWEDNHADPDRMNFRDTEIAATSAAGCFPGGVSPNGVQEMNGNVWEWSRSLWDLDYELIPPPEWPVEEVRLAASRRRVWRGGSFGSLDRLCRCANRNFNYPDSRDGRLGFRLALLPFPDL